MTSIGDTRGSPRSTLNSRGTIHFPPQLHTNHEILPCTLEVVLLCCSVSKESPRSLLELERVLDTLYETPEVYPDTRPNSRGTLSFPPQVKNSPIFPSSSRDEGQLPYFFWKGMPSSPHTSRRGWYLFDLEWNPRDLSKFGSHVFSHPFESRPDSLALIRMSAENQLTTQREL